MPFNSEWPVWQLCANDEDFAWQDVARELWEFVAKSMQAGSASLRKTMLLSQLYWPGQRFAKRCWRGALALQMWVLSIKFPEVQPWEFAPEWRLLAEADWSLLLLSDFPLFGLLRISQWVLNSCTLFVEPQDVPEVCPLPLCDGRGSEFEDSFMVVAEALQNSAVFGGEELFFAAPSGRMGCPLAEAAKDLSRAIVHAAHFGAESWDEVRYWVGSAQHHVLTWLEEADALGAADADPAAADPAEPSDPADPADPAGGGAAGASGAGGGFGAGGAGVGVGAGAGGGNASAPRWRRRRALADPFGELLSSRWPVFGALHALQVLLHRHADHHPVLPLPWLLAAGPGSPGRGLLADESSARGTFARYFLANLRSEFWGGTDGVQRLVRSVLRGGGLGRRRGRRPRGRRRRPEDGFAAGGAFVDVGALCVGHECLLADILQELRCSPLAATSLSTGAHVAGGVSDARRLVEASSPRVFGFEPNRQNLRRTATRLASLPGRWRHCLKLRRAALSNATAGTVSLFGMGGKASLKPEAYQGQFWAIGSAGDVERRPDRHAETVEVLRLADWAASLAPPLHFIDVLKVDVEGSEWEVLQGAEPLLSEQRVGLLVVEYSHFWGAFSSSSSSSTPRSGVGARRTGDLHSVAVYLAMRGYDGYFVGTRHHVPFSGEGMRWWHDVYEVCADPGNRIFRGLVAWCWLNVAFVLRDSPLGELAARSWPPWSLVPIDDEPSR